MGTTRNGIWMPATDDILRRVEEDPMIYLMDHPVIQHKITLARKKETGKRDMCDFVHEIGSLIFYEMTRHLEMQLINIETPMMTTTSPELAGKKPVLVQVMRAGIAMVSGARMAVMPSAKVASIGVCRNDKDITKPNVYLRKLPTEMDKREAFILDPMLATGYSAYEVINVLKEAGCTKIHFACIFSVWEGISLLREKQPDVDLYVGVVDAGLDDHYYILPGAGDMGDRLDGTK